MDFSSPPPAGPCQASELTALPLFYPPKFGLSFRIRLKHPPCEMVLSKLLLSISRDQGGWLGCNFLRPLGGCTDGLQHWAETDLREASSRSAKEWSPPISRSPRKCPFVVVSVFVLISSQNLLWT